MMQEAKMPEQPGVIEPRFYTVKDACKFLGISRTTLLEAEDLHLIQAARTPGGLRRFRREDLADYLDRLGSNNHGYFEGTQLLPATPKSWNIEASDLMSPESALRQIVLLLQVEMGGIFTFVESGCRLALSTSFRIPRWLINNHSSIGLDGISGLALSRLEPVVFAARESELPLAEGQDGQGICVPLIAGGQKLGTIQVFSTQRRYFFPSEINITATFAVFLAELLAYRHLLQSTGK
jgi:excisionase family DNA binding protein